MSKRQRVEDASKQIILPDLFLLFSAENQDVDFFLGAHLSDALAKQFNLHRGTFLELSRTFPDPTSAPVVCISTLLCSNNSSSSSSSASKGGGGTASLLEVVARLDERGYRRTGCTWQALCMASDKSYFGIWAIARGVRKPPPILASSSLNTKTLSLSSPVLVKRATMSGVYVPPALCHTYGELTTALQHAAGERSVIEPVVEGLEMRLVFVSGELTSWFEITDNADNALHGQKEYNARPLSELPSAITEKLYVFRSFLQELQLEDVVSFDVQLEDDSHCVHALEAHVGGAAAGGGGGGSSGGSGGHPFETFGAEESALYCEWLKKQACKPFALKAGGLCPVDCEWEVVVEGERAQHAYEGELEVTRSVLGVSAECWRVHWAKSPIDCKTEPHETGTCASSPLQPARALVDIVRGLVHTPRTSSKPRCLWFLYDYNDGAEQLEWLSKQNHGMVLIAPSVDSYRVSSSKIAMKRCFVRDGVPTAPFTERLLTEAADFLDCPPWFVKPDGSFASIGIYTDNKVKSPEDMKRIWERTEKFECGVFAEHFLRGRECTVLVSGKVNAPVVFNPVERVFRSGLSGHQEDNNWDNFYFVSLQDGDPWGEACKTLASAAYRSIDAAPYARVDIRGNFVLEVNTVPAYSLTDLAYSLAKALNGEPSNWQKFWNSVWEARK